MSTDNRPITDLLRVVAEGKREGLNELVELLYTTLLRRCRNHLQSLPAGLLTPTALLNALYIDLSARYPNLVDRGHFFAYAQVSIKHLVLSSFRKERAKKRGGNLIRVDMEDVDLPDEREGTELIEAFEVLARVEAQDPELAEIIKLRVFDGRSERETAELLGIPRKKLQKQWITARSLLAHLLGLNRRKSDGTL